MTRQNGYLTILIKIIIIYLHFIFLIKLIFYWTNWKYYLISITISDYNPNKVNYHEFEIRTNRMNWNKQGNEINLYVTNR